MDLLYRLDRAHKSFYSLLRLLPPLRSSFIRIYCTGWTELTSPSTVFSASSRLYGAHYTDLLYRLDRAHKSFYSLLRLLPPLRSSFYGSTVQVGPSSQVLLQSSPPPPASTELILRIYCTGWTELTSPSTVFSASSRLYGGHSTDLLYRLDRPHKSFYSLLHLLPPLRSSFYGSTVQVGPSSQVLLQSSPPPPASTELILRIYCTGWTELTSPSTVFSASSRLYGAHFYGSTVQVGPSSQVLLQSSPPPPASTELILRIYCTGWTELTSTSTVFSASSRLYGAHFYRSTVQVGPSSQVLLQSSPPPPASTELILRIYCTGWTELTSPSTVFSASSCLYGAHSTDLLYRQLSGNYLAASGSSSNQSTKAPSFSTSRAFPLDTTLSSLASLVTKMFTVANVHIWSIDMFGVSLY